MTDRTVAVNLVGRAQSLMAAFASGKKAAGDFKSELDDLGKKSPQKLNDIALATGAVGASLLGMAGYAVKASMDFDRQMSEVSAVSNATGKDLQGLRALAIQAGKDTQYSATEAAQAEAELAKAGVTTADIMGGALSGSLALAAAGQMGLADAASISAQAMNMFELKGQNVTHIADVLASAANTSAADMHGLGMGLQQVGLVAHQAGFSLEETVGVLAAFADRGLEGSDGATSLKTAIQRLTAPTDQARTLMDALGISVYDANGNVRHAADLAGTLQTSLGKLSVEQRNTALNTIFGADAIRAATVLYGLGESGVRKYTAAVDKNGSAAATAAQKTNNLAGDLERLKGSIDTLAIQSGSGANGGLRTLVQGVDGLVGAFSSLPGPVQTSLTVIAGVGGAGLLATAGLLKTRQTAQEAMTALSAMGPAGTRAATALGTIGSVAGKLGLVGLAVGGMWMGLDALSDWAAKKHAPVKADIDSLTDSMKQFADSGRVAGELASKYGQNLQKIGKDAADVAKGMADLAEMQRLVREGLSANEALQGWEPVNPQQVQRVKDLDTALAGLVKGGGATQAKLFLDQMLSSGRLTADQFVALTGMLPQYQAAADAAGVSNSGLAKGFGDTESNARTMAGSLDAAVRAGQSLKQVFDQLNGGFINSAQAAIAMETAIDAVGESVNKHGNSLNIDTEAGRSNQKTLLDGATAARDAAQAKYEETGSLEAAKGVYDGYIQRLRQSALDAGLNKDQVELLVTSISKMPPLKATTITTPGLDGAISRVATLSQYIAGLSDKTVTITTLSNYYAGTGKTPGGQFAVPSVNRWGGAYEHAADGALRDANIYSAVSSGARYAFAEPETGGELFAPKFGDLARTRSMVDYAVTKWWGGQAVMWGSGAGGGSGGGGQQAGPTLQVYPHPGASTAEIVAEVMRELAWQMG